MSHIILTSLQYSTAGSTAAEEQLILPYLGGPGAELSRVHSLASHACGQCNICMRLNVPCTTYPLFPTQSRMLTHIMLLHQEAQDR